MNKKEKLLALVKKRQSFHWDGYKNIGDYHSGKYECDYVSPYTKSANNLDAKVMIFLQDWASHDFLQSNFDEEVAELGYAPSLPTNINLVDMLQNYFGLKFKDVYITNLFPFIKPNSMNTRIPFQHMVYAAKEFGLPQIEIISPKIVIALGRLTFNGLYKASENKVVRNLEEGINKVSPFYYQESAIFCQAHTGNLGKNNRNKGGSDRISKDWEKMSKFLI